MASAFLRNSRLRHLYNSLHSPWRSSILQPAPHESLHTSSFSSSSHQIYAANQYKLIPFFSMPHRALSTTTAHPVANQSSSSSNANSMPPSSASPEESSGNTNHGEKSGSLQGKPIRGGPVSWMSFFLLLCTGAGLVYYYDREKKRRIEAINKASTAVKEGPSVGKAAIGGPFSLVDHDGKPVTEKSFLGQWNLIYFGFTHCPDICPDELQKLASAIDKIKEKSKFEVVPVFISVDPERDTVEQVREYVKEFHPKLIGLTGTPEEVKKAARAYRVYYMKAEEEDSSDYLVDHSIVMYLMDPNMEFVKFFGKNLDDTELANGIIQEIKQHKHKVVNV